MNRRCEKETRAPAFDIVRDIAVELSVPPSFFYESDDTLAEILLYLGRMGDAGGTAMLEALKRSVVEGDIFGP